MHQFAKLSLALGLLVSIVSASPAVRLLLDGRQPDVVTVGPSAVHGGDPVLCTVHMNGQVDSDTTVAISTSDSASFPYLPATVTVPAGSDYVSFYTYVGWYASGNPTISASANGLNKTSAAETILPN